MTQTNGVTNRRCLALLMILLIGETALAQEAANGIGERLLADAAVRAALDSARLGEPQVLEDQVRLCQIPAPTFHEERRAGEMRRLFEALQLRNVRIDTLGNVIGERPGKNARPHLLLASHLDTVFPEDTALAVSREGALFKGPGIGDNCRGLATMLGVIRALAAGRIVTPGTITFVANVREEGLGDLGGARHLLDGEFKGRVDRFLSIDGSGIGFTHLAVGTQRYRVSFLGPGGHSYYAFGNANPMHAMGRAIAAIADIQVPEQPKTTFSVGRSGGGTSINSIAFETWMEIDMRSHDRASLAALVAAVKSAVGTAVDRENARWNGRGAVRTEWKELGAAPPGMMPATSAIVEAATSVTKVLGLPIATFPSTTDSNVAMALGIPALTIDGGGGGAGGHSLRETFVSTDSWKGTQRALLLAIALTHP
jgi:acetylornithine deacetylase/succinyl-diaminopimelate desuccinylase-like protein